MAKKDTKKTKVDPKKESVKGRLLFFAVVAGAITGYLLFQAGREKPVQPEQGVSNPAPPEPNQGASARPMSWSEGETMPAVSLLSLSGDRLELRVSGDARPVLLFIFSPTCSICTQNIPAWRELFDEAKSRSVEVVGISVLDTVRTTRYVDQHQLPWNVFCAAGRDAVQALRVERVPMTLLVEGSGRVAMSMRGKLNQEQKQVISQFMAERTGSD